MRPEARVFYVTDKVHKQKDHHSNNRLHSRAVMPVSLFNGLSIMDCLLVQTCLHCEGCLDGIDMSALNSVFSYQSELFSYKYFHRECHLSCQGKKLHQH
jgi:hypothetical protein